MAHPLRYITNEHHAIAAVLVCLESILSEVEEAKLATPFDAFAVIIDYFQDFPDRFHHPKEDEYLFPAVLRRRPDLAPTIDALQASHHDMPRRTAALRWALEAYREDPETGFAAFRQAARDFIDLQRHHIVVEERDILAVARAVLTEEDLAPIEKAFTDHEDPLLGDRPQRHFADLFTRIVNLAPAPHGTAERHAPKPRPAADDKGPPETWQSSLIKHFHWV